MILLEGINTCARLNTSVDVPAPIKNLDHSALLPIIGYWDTPLAAADKVTAQRYGFLGTTGNESLSEQECSSTMGPPP